MHVPSAFSSLGGPALRLQPDSRLTALASAGAERAFEEIVRRYRRPLVAFAAGIVAPDRAEDVVQEALLRAHRKLSANDAVRELRPWLYAIVRNLALNDLRDEPVHELLDDGCDGVPQPPDVAARRAELANLVTAIQALPADQEAAIVKRELEGRSHDEIAAALKVTPQAARGLIFRARARLRSSVGCLLPLPLLRALLGPERAGAAFGAGGPTAVKALGIATGTGGPALAAKGAAALFVVLAVGSGVGLQHRGDSLGVEVPPSSAAAGDPRGVGAARSFAGTQRGPAARGGLAQAAAKSNVDARGAKRRGAAGLGGGGEATEHSFQGEERDESSAGAPGAAAAAEPPGTDAAARRDPAGGGSDDELAEDDDEAGEAGYIDVEEGEDPFADEALGGGSGESGDEPEIEGTSADPPVGERSSEGEAGGDVTLDDG